MPTSSSLVAFFKSTVCLDLLILLPESSQGVCCVSCQMLFFVGLFQSCAFLQRRSTTNMPIIANHHGDPPGIIGHATGRGKASVWLNNPASSADLGTQAASVFSRMLTAVSFSVCPPTGVKELEGQETNIVKKAIKFPALVRNGLKERAERCSAGHNHTPPHKVGRATHSRISRTPRLFQAPGKEVLRRH
ncbi:hypothetical protein SODALDRAFT_48731 [Sodiomyces alkalinus F11]|uniref:Secreted protein n=1 Tax=Sodiomyces alkalinus (strain CBS 110278 / VKM F-3762 / F11) TaxID=1314773 RepID=A0A3N2PMB9_SODAK|nr:hypothetical protein SODALDRAFT_48731 [Sodiomyces alkalinus F11]ROT35681.1 hypothetical protein SODALDRAFT_48731 [Sodiomyces alkalinus F11]